MIFSELYSTYYNTVAEILKVACDHPLKQNELRQIISEKAFGESVLQIEPALMNEQWQLLCSDGKTPINHVPSMPLTTLQKRWINAIALDPRVRLFTDELTTYPEVQPLFRPEDVCVFDQYGDGDPYNDPKYIRHFRMILSAIKTQTPLGIDTMTRKDYQIHRTVLPEQLEYSAKDDKFRLIGSGCRYGSIINLARITNCYVINHPVAFPPEKKREAENRTVELEILNLRNTLERLLMHFAHFAKEATRIDHGRYKVTITYDKEDETEVLIRVLSFGPMVRVAAPDHFRELIIERLIQQKSCGQ